MKAPPHKRDRRQPFERGDRLTSRGSRWTLVEVEAGDNCTALHLSSDDAPRLRTLLSPFDRFNRVACTTKAAVVDIRCWLRHVQCVYAGSSPTGGLQAAAAARIQLLPYQLEPALAVLRHGATRVLVADAVGLGKTVQAGVIVAELARTHSSLRALILVPAGLRDQWAQELTALFRLHPVSADAAWLQASAAERPVDANPWALPGVYLASRDFVKRPEVLRPLEEVAWDLLILDEAHAASSQTDRRAAAHAIAVRSTRVVLLTATPHADNAAEFAALCSIGRIDPAEPRVLVFRRSRQDVSLARRGFTTAIAGVSQGHAPGPRRSRLLAIRTTADERRMHDLLEAYTKAVWRESEARGDDLARLAAIVLRKRALSSAASLAASIRRRVALLAGASDPREQLRLPLGDEDPPDDDVPAAVLGAPGLVNAPRERRWLAAILEAAWRASGAESKTRFLKRFLARVREPALIFTEYRDTLVRLNAALAMPGRTLLLLHGGLAPAERSRVQRRFNEGGAVLLATDAASEGLNLHQHCRLVVHHELPWSLSRLEQRAGRVDRLGQQRRVHELGLVSMATAERLVLEPLIRRAGLVRSSLQDAHGLSVALTESHVAELILGEKGPDLLRRTDVSVDVTGLTRALDLRSESLVETARLIAVREQVGSGSIPAIASPTRPRIAVTACKHARVAAGVVVVYLITLSSAAGRQVHAEPLVLQVEPRAMGWLERAPARALRLFAGTVTGPAQGPLARAIADAVHRALDFAVPVHGGVATALQARHRAMHEMRSQSAGQLVQAGLFDRGEWVSAPGPSSPASPPRYERDRFSGCTASALAVDVRLVGLLHIRRR